jgi:hypothetical protein
MPWDGVDRRRRQHLRANLLQSQMQLFFLCVLGFAVLEMIAFAGMALLSGRMEQSGYFAIASGLFGIIGGGALGFTAGSATAARGPNRSTDPQSNSPNPTPPPDSPNPPKSDLPAAPPELS